MNTIRFNTLVHIINIMLMDTKKREFYVQWGQRSKYYGNNFALVNFRSRN